jgi:SAM-dependent methyltransferase
MVDHRDFYAARADDYERLVSAEDAGGALGPALGALLPLDGARVIEIGAGTGRLTELLLERGACVVACEPAAAMREVARRRLASDRLELRAEGVEDLVVGDARFDLAIAGWVLGHFVEWHAPRGLEVIGAALDRMTAALRPGGVLAVIETLGTGETEPRPPTPGLAAYYAWLEQERGLSRTVLVTDYAFADVETAATVTGAFFGQDFAARVRRERWARVPERTGLWTTGTRI